MKLLEALEAADSRDLEDIRKQIVEHEKKIVALKALEALISTKISSNGGPPPCPVRVTPKDLPAGVTLPDPKPAREPIISKAKPRFKRELVIEQQFVPTVNPIEELPAPTIPTTVSKPLSSGIKPPTLYDQIKAHIEKHGPSRPALMAHELDLTLEQVMTQQAMFFKGDKGWMLEEPAELRA